MIAAPMSTQHPAAVRPLGRLIVVSVTAAALLTACGTSTPTPVPTPSPGTSATAAATATPSPTPRPTPVPTPRFTNEPDPALTALIPDEVAGEVVVKPAVTDFAYTPGDIGEVYGGVGLRFQSLQVAYIAPRRLSLYAVRMNRPFATTADLEPYLAAAGEYVGIAGLHREPWELKTVAGNVVWVRPEDNATAAGTMIYTWAVTGYVFLMIGTDDTLNQAMVAALPGEPAPTPTPRPSRSPRPSASATPEPSPSG